MKKKCTVIGMMGMKCFLLYTSMYYYKVVIKSTSYIPFIKRALVNKVPEKYIVMTYPADIFHDRSSVRGGCT